MEVKKVKIDWTPELSIYASEKFLETVSNEYGWVGGYDNGKLICILPYSVIRKAIFCLVRFPTQTIFMQGGADQATESEFLKKAVNYFKNLGTDVIIPPMVNTVFSTFPDGAMAAPYGSHIIDLTQGENALWNKVHSKHRNVIRNASKKGVIIKSGPEYIETAYHLVKGSFSRSANGLLGKLRLEMRMDLDSFRKQVIGFGEYVRIFIAEHEGTTQAAVVIPFSRHCAYYMHGGSIDHPLTGAMNFLQWETIRTFAEQGVHYYDFCGARIDPEKGSKAEGLIKFKERFGGDLKKGFTWKYALNPLKYYLYSRAAGIRSGGDVVDQEGHKLKAESN